VNEEHKSFMAITQRLARDSCLGTDMEFQDAAEMTYHLAHPLTKVISGQCSFKDVAAISSSI